MIRGDGYVGSRWKSALPYMMLIALTDVEAILLGIGVYVISFSVRRLEQVVCKLPQWPLCKEAVSCS
jgi:hypothetical protein